MPRQSNPVVFVNTGKNQNSKSLNSIHADFELILFS